MTKKSKIERAVSETLERISQTDKRITELKAERAENRADMALLNPMGSDYAIHVARIGEIDRSLFDLEKALSDDTEALVVLRARLAKKTDPAALEAAQRNKEEVARQREIIDKNLTLFAKHVRSAMKALGAIADAEAIIRSLHPSFDKMHFGRASILSWLQDALSFFTGKGAYVLKESAPTEPGTEYPPIAAILRDMDEDED